eukprot:3429669-Prymnesium_polylepis.2
MGGALGGAHLGLLAQVECHVLGEDARLELPHLGVLAAPPEKAWAVDAWDGARSALRPVWRRSAWAWRGRGVSVGAAGALDVVRAVYWLQLGPRAGGRRTRRLDAEVAELLLLAVDDRVHELDLHLVLLHLGFLLLLGGEALLDGLLVLEVRHDEAEVALFQILRGTCAIAAAVGRSSRTQRSGPRSMLVVVGGGGLPRGAQQKGRAARARRERRNCTRRAGWAASRGGACITRAAARV